MPPTCMTRMQGVVGILLSILLSEGRREKGAKLPQTAACPAFHVQFKVVLWLVGAEA